MPLTPADLNKLLGEVMNLVSPVWPLQDYVAVNPFMGLADRKFIDAARIFDSVGDIQALPAWSELQQGFSKGKFEQSDLLEASVRIRDELQTNVPTIKEVLSLLQGSQNRLAPQDKSADDARNVAEYLDKTRGTDWQVEIQHAIGQQCGAWYDRGQAIWKLDREGSSLFSNWKQTATVDRRPEMVGATGFRAFVTSLPDCPIKAIQECLTQLSITKAATRTYLWNLCLSIAGWSSWVRYQVFEAAKSGEQKSDFNELLAIRIAWDAALLSSTSSPVDLQSVHESLSLDIANRVNCNDTLAKYIALTAQEIAFEHKLLGSIDTKKNAPQQAPDRPVAQMVFCIDVRSERIRRHLESVESRIQTFGFAGFFGVPMSLKALGESSSQPQVPAPLSSAFEVSEGVRGVSETDAYRIESGRGFIRAIRKGWKQFQTSATGCFGFVEASGLAFIVKLTARTLGLQRHHTENRFDGISEAQHHLLGPVLAAFENPEQVTNATDLAEKILRGIGLTQNTGRLIVLCGHNSETENNPLKAALDCGACCGHSGEANARYAAAVLNHPAVRQKLHHRGFAVAADTWFVPAVHNTTKDEIDFYDTDLIPASHQSDFATTLTASQQAGKATLSERLPQLQTQERNDGAYRSIDWSEVRPEWGLAGNAAFLIGRRQLTASSHLQGRCFLHSYDAQTDDGFQILEQIMTAPLVVGHWINMQYYASTVDNKHLGSGSKTIHNVVGQFGIYSGNGGDLQTGLPWQCVHDGNEFRHDPVRLLAVIEAPRDAVLFIIRKHGLLEQLVRNRWLNLVVIDDGHLFSSNSNLDWQEQCYESRSQTDTSGHEFAPRSPEYFPDSHSAV